MILFITRKYPPAIGGMENLSYHLIAEIERNTAASVIAWGRSQKWLPVFVIWALGRAMLIMSRHPIRAVHIGDAVLSPLGLFLGFAASVPVFTIAHGLDVTYPNPLYQCMIRFCLKRLGGIVCMSEYVRSECLKRGVLPSRCTVIHPGAEAIDNPEQLGQNRTLLEQKSGRQLVGCKILLSVGRLVERKGFVWFVRQVLPTLIVYRPDIVYLICGEGPQRRTLETEIERSGLASHVCLLGQVDREVLRTAYACADVFVMPNIFVPGDPEGFGLVTLEARAAGTPVIAADLEGVRESIAQGIDGLLIGAGDAQGFVKATLKVLNDEAGLLPREQIRTHILQRASWSSMAAQYLEQCNAWMT